MPRDPDSARRNLFITVGSIVVIAVGLLVHARLDASQAAAAEARRAVCHGEPLHALNAREKALEEGFDVDRHHRCITRASWEAHQKREAERLAYNAPEAVERRARQREADAALAAERRQAREAERAARRAALDARVAAVEVRRVEINSASLADLQTLAVLGEQTARDIVNARTQRAFRDWGDVVHRILALSSARNAAEASISGLTVNGEALSGAEMNPAVARMLARRVFERS